MSRKSRTLKQVARIPVIGKLFEKARSNARVYRGIHSLRRTASPLYYLIRAFFKTVIRTQHSEIQAIGLENIPADGPVILVGNHPNSFLDYFNLINIIRHPVATAAKDVITNWFIIGPLLRNHMLMVPIARKQDQSLTDISEDDRREAKEKSVRESVELLCRGRLYN
ncbi:MAG: 1-acyl-sn-glycerol-3-phosphate acyltransferase, partial [Leptospiraceae bacterium]|nr:1-acyl-sn-glycerol-3-phosphate acyltransferase [Leptospiraceae bacterium]